MCLNMQKPEDCLLQCLWFFEVRQMGEPNRHAMLNMAYKNQEFKIVSENTQMTHPAYIPPYLRNLSICYHDVHDLSNAEAVWEYIIRVMPYRRCNEFQAKSE